MRTALLLAVAAAFIPQPSSANMIVYNTTGTFGASVPNSAFTAPSETWTLHFQLDEFPVVTAGSDYFEVSPVDFHYSLGGTDLGLTPSALYFLDSSNFGMFAVEFGGPSDSLAFAGPVMFSGSVSAPTMLIGTFVDDNSGSADGVFVGGVYFQSLNGAVLEAVYVPEPATISVVAFGALAITVAAKRRRAPRE